MRCCGWCGVGGGGGGGEGEGGGGGGGEGGGGEGGGGGGGGGRAVVGGGGVGERCDGRSCATHFLLLRAVLQGTNVPFADTCFLLLRDTKAMWKGSIGMAPSQWAVTLYNQTVVAHWGQFTGWLVQGLALVGVDIQLQEIAHGCNAGTTYSQHCFPVSQIGNFPHALA